MVSLFLFSSFMASWVLNYQIPSLVALVFDPDRFLDDRLQKYLLPNPFIFLPFNAGPRICLGQQVSPVRSRSVVVLTLRHLDSLHTTKCPCSSSDYCRRSLV